MPSTRLLAVSGILAPLFYLIATALTVWFRPEYSLVSDSVSQLANLDEPFAILFILVGAVPVGLLAVIFTYAVWTVLPDNTAMLAGIVLLAHEGFGIIFSFGVFPRSGPSPGVMHIGAGIYAIACGVAARLLLARPLQQLGRFYLPLTVAVAIAVPVLILGVARLSSMPGLYERIAHGLVLGWMAAVAVSILLHPETETETETD